MSVAARFDPAKNVARREFCTKLALIHDEAHRLGLNETGHILHEAVRRVGFETAQIEETIGWRAARAAVPPETPK